MYYPLILLQKRNFLFLSTRGTYHFVLTQLQDISDKWIYFLLHATDYDAPPQQLQKTEPLIKAFNALERGRWTKQELITYEKMIDAERVEKSVLKTAETRGEEKGLIKVAKEMLAQNFAIDVICKITGLSKQEVEELRKT